MIRSSLILLLSFLAMTPPLQASQVLWGSARFANNYLSSGSPNALSDDFTFQLGAFKPGFTPSKANIGQWLDNWTPAQSASYNPTTKFFTGSFVYSQSESPFLPSNRGYIFGFDRTAKTAESNTGEWILVSNLNWNWPSGGGIAPPSQWSVSTATEVIVGSINDPGEAFHMKTEKVTLTQEATALEQWLSSNFPGLGAAADLDADPDNDLLTNVLEYALDTDPNSPNPDRTLNLAISDAFGVEILFVKSGLRANTQLMVESSSDLTNWKTGDVPITDDSPFLVRFRDKQKPTAGQARYYRLHATVTN